jgi:hypothetical protein
MSISTATTHVTPAAVITHTIATIRGSQDADVTVFHARTPDVRIALSWGGILMTIYTADTAQGLLEAFSAARAAMSAVPQEIPAAPPPPQTPCALPTLAIDWTRRPTYAVLPQAGPNRIKTAIVHWVDLHTGPITWQIRDQIGLTSTLDLLTRAHRTAIAVCLDGHRHAADPTSADYTPQ